MTPGGDSVSVDLVELLILGDFLIKQFGLRFSPIQNKKERDYLGSTVGRRGLDFQLNSGAWLVG